MYLSQNMLSSIAICTWMMLFTPSGALMVQKCFTGNSTSEHWAKKDTFTVTGISLLKILGNKDDHRCFSQCIRSPVCDVAVAEKKNKTCPFRSVQEGHFSLEKKPDSVVYVKENISAEVNKVNNITPTSGNLRVFSNLSPAVYPGCPDEDNYYTTTLGDCYYIPDIGGSLKIGTWSEAFEFCKAISLNMWIIDSPLEEITLTDLWPKVTGGHSDRLWIGLRDVDASSSQSYAWKLHDDTQVPFDAEQGALDWIRPSESQKDNQCAMWDLQTAQWFQDHCTAGRRFICEKPQGIED